MYNEDHEYPLLATAECFVCIKRQSYNLTRCIWWQLKLLVC